MAKVLFDCEGKQAEGFKAMLLEKYKKGDKNDEL
jgi:hypothetical protein